MSDSDTSLDRSAPMLREHTDLVLQGLLGYDDDRLADLRSGGIVKEASADGGGTGGEDEQPEPDAGD